MKKMCPFLFLHKTNILDCQNKLLKVQNYSEVNFLQDNKSIIL